MASGCNSAFDITALAPLLIFGVFILFMYFFMLRPQKKQERETNDMRNNLKVGDENLDTYFLTVMIADAFT